MRKIWPFTFYFMMFSAIAFIAPFVVLFYQDLGFSGTQIGLLTGIVPLITLFSAPLWTGLADATHRHRLLMSLGLIGGVITVAFFPILNTFVPVFIIAVLLYFFFAPVNPLADSATMSMLAEEKEMYGRVRLGGTLGFGIGAFLSGLVVQNYGLKFAFWGCALLFLLGFFVSQKLVYGQLEEGRPAGEGPLTLLKNPRWVLFLVVAFAAGMGLAAYSFYLFPYMKELGASESTMGLALTFWMFSEIPILFFGNRLIKYLKPYGLLMLAMGVTGLRMLLFAVIGTPNLVLFAQILNGLTFPAMWVAGVTYADENAPAGLSATAQGLFSAMVSGVGAAVGGFVGGLLLESIGGRGLYLIIGSAVLVITTSAVLIQARLVSRTAVKQS